MRIKQRIRKREWDWMKREKKQQVYIHAGWQTFVHTHTHTHNIYARSLTLAHTQNDSKLMPMHYIVKWSEMKWMEMESIAKQNGGRMEQKKISK